MALAEKFVRGVWSFYGIGFSMDSLEPSIIFKSGIFEIIFGIFPDSISFQLFLQKKTETTSDFSPQVMLK